MSAYSTRLRCAQHVFKGSSDNATLINRENGNNGSNAQLLPCRRYCIVTVTSSYYFDVSPIVLE